MNRSTIETVEAGGTRVGLREAKDEIEEGIEEERQDNSIRVYKGKLL